CDDRPSPHRSRALGRYRGLTARHDISRRVQHGTAATSATGAAGYRRDHFDFNGVVAEHGIGRSHYCKDQDRGDEPFVDTALAAVARWFRAAIDAEAVESVLVE